MEVRHEVINKAINFIFEHLDEDITVDDVARHCAYSRYHLTRLFKENTDEALYQFIKRLKLERSAWLMKVERERSITDIGEHYGYSSSNFATAFKKQWGMSPADFRRNYQQIVEDSSFAHGASLESYEEWEKNVTIEYYKGFNVLYERKKGNYHELPVVWCEFIDKYRHLANEKTLYLECTIDDPSITDEDCCMYELWQTIDDEGVILSENPGLLTQTIPGGKYAVYHFKGKHQLLYMVFQRMFCIWLSKTGNTLDERHIFDIYRNVGDNGYLELDICFPIK
ncbi:MAG: AraC family transcriptional regulator [Lachnospiraceae bacterium]|nr:AraC family transcriptional regulator [Lachnospiraceae bacterium]